MMTATHSIVTYILAGTCFFMLGMGLVSENLQKLAANRIRDVVAKISTRSFLSVFAGIAITVLIQSSGAVTSMLVGLGSAGVITLRQVMGIILGTGVGTTVTVQLLSLNIAQYGLPIFAVCFTIYFLTHRTFLKRIMAALMGFGLMFWGIEMISMGSNQLRDLELITNSLGFIRQNPSITLLLAAVFTAVVHSSAVTIGIAMTLAGSGLISTEDAFYVVYGANLGTTATALMASAGGNYVGRQVAWAHCFHKLIMVSLFYFATPWVAEWISTNAPLRDVANAHLLFNVVGTVLFLPFINLGASLVEQLIQPGPQDKEFSVKYLDRVNQEAPVSVAMAHAEREILRMGDIVLSMVRDSVKLFKNEDSDLFNDMRNRDNKVDLLNREISIFLSQVMERNRSADHSQIVRLISYATDLESAADVIENSLLELARKKHNLKVEFSAEGWQEIAELLNKVVHVSEMSLSCFQTSNKDLAARIVAQKREIRSLEKNLREAHISRLVSGRKESINTSSIHMDVLSDLRRVVSHMSNHVYPLLRSIDTFGAPSRQGS
jgi:phosphate:Na+ symporter